MNCKEAIDLAEEAMDKDLPRVVKRRLDLHLSRCESCRRLFEAERDEHARWFRIFNEPAAMRSLPPGFADRLAASARLSRSGFWFRVPRWLKIAACFAALLSGAAFAAAVVVDAVVGNDGGGEATERTQAAEGTDGDDAPAASAAMSDIPYVPDVASVPSTEPDNQQPTTDGQLKGENEMNIKHRAAAALAAATLAASPASATELPWTGGDAALGDGKVTILCDENGIVTNVTAKPTGGEELRITGSAMTFADGAKISLAAESGTFADGRLVFANDVTAEGALTLNRTDGAFMIWSGNRLVGVEWVNAFAANGSQASDWAAHSAYAVPTDAGISENELPYGIYRPISSNTLTCNRWSGKYTFSARFQLQNVSTGYLQVRMLTGVRTSAGLYLPNTDTWSTTKYRTSTASDAQWFWYNDTPVDNVTLQYGGDEYKFGICRIIFHRKNTNMGTIGFAGEATMAGTVTVSHGVKMSVMAKADSTFAAPQFSGYGDVEYARDTTLSQANAIVHGTMSVTNATVAVAALGAMPKNCTIVVDKDGILDFSQATGARENLKTDFEVRTGGKILSYAAGNYLWKFGNTTPFRLLGGTLECNVESGRSVNYVYLNRLLMMDGATLKANKPFWVGNGAEEGYWTIGGTGATVDCPVEFLSASSTGIRRCIVNVNDGATLTFANTLACNSGYTVVDFIKKGGGTVVCQSTCHPTAITDGLKVQGGVWKLGISNSWLNARPLTLDGGAIAGADNTANTVGALTVAENGGTIELDPGATLAFANSTNKTWSGTLIIKGFRERAVRFGDSAAALVRDQLDMIRAEKPNGKKMHLCLDSNGYLAPLGMMIRIR